MKEEWIAFIKAKKKLLSLLLVFAMLASLLSTAAFATEETPSTSEPGVSDSVDVPQPPAGDENADNENADTALPQPPAGDEDEDISTVNLFRGDVRATPANIALDLKSAQWVTKDLNFKFPAATVTGDSVYSMTITVSDGSISAADLTGATMTERENKSATWVYATPKTVEEATAALRAVTFGYVEGMKVTVTTADEATALSKISATGAWTGETSLLMTGNAKIADADSITRTLGTLVQRSAHVATDYYWACGPEAGKVDNDLSGAPWKQGEPNGGTISNPVDSTMGLASPENCVQALPGSGKLNDMSESNVTDTTYQVHGYFVEFGGYTSGANPDPTGGTATDNETVTAASVLLTNVYVKDGGVGTKSGADATNAVATLAAAYDLVGDNGTIQGESGSKTITRGFNSTGNAATDCLFNVTKGDVTFEDITLDGVSSTAAYVGNTSQLIHLLSATSNAADAVVRLGNGAVLQNAKSGYGSAAVYVGTVNGNPGTLYIENGAEVKDNECGSASARSNVIEVQNGNLFLNGGTITDNKLANAAGKAGAIYALLKGSIELNGARR